MTEQVLAPTDPNYAKQPDMSLANLTNGLPSLADVKYSQRQKDYINGLTDIWFNDPNRQAYAEYYSEIFYGMRPTPLQNLRNDLITQVKAIGAPREDTGLPSFLAEIIATAQLEMDPKKYSEERGKLAQIRGAFGTDSLQGKDLEKLYLYNLYHTTFKDQVLPLTILQHPAARGLNENDFKILKDIVITSDPRWAEYKEQSYASRILSYNKMNRELVQAVTSGKLSREEYQQQVDALNFLESDRGFWREIATGMSNVGQQLKWAIDEGFTLNEDEKKLAASFGADNASASALFYGASALGKMLKNAQSMTTELQEAQVVSKLSEETGQSFTDLWQSRAKLRNHITNKALFVNYGTLFFGGGIAKLGIGALSKGIMAISIGRAEPLLKSALGGAVTNVIGSTLPFVGIYQSMEGLNEVDRTEFSNKLLNQNKSLIGAFGSGFTHNFMENMMMGAVFGAPTLAFGAVRQAKALITADKFGRQSSIEQQGATLSNASVSPQDAADLINAAVDHGESTIINQATQLNELSSNHEYYFNSRELLNRLKQNNIELESLPAAQQNLLADLEEKAARQEQVVISTGDYTVLFKDESELKQILENIKQDSPDGVPHESLNEYVAQADADMARDLAALPEYATTPAAERDAMIRASHTTLLEETQAEIHKEISNANLDNLSAREVTQVANNVVSFFTSLMEVMGVESSRITEVYHKYKPTFKYLPSTLDITTDSPKGLARGTYDYASNEIHLRNDSDVITVTHELLHYYLETVMKVADDMGEASIAGKLQKELLEPYIKEPSFGLKPGTKWADLTPEMKRQIHEEFVYTELVHRLDANLPGVERSSRAAGPFNRTIGNALVRFHMGEQLKAAGQQVKLTPENIAQTKAIAGADFEAKYGYSSNRFSQSNLFNTFDEWTNRDFAARSVAEEFPISGSLNNLPTAEQLRGFLTPEEMAIYDQLTNGVFDFMSDAANQGALLHSEEFLRQAKAIGEKVRRFVQDDPAIVRAKQVEQARAQAAQEAQAKLDTANKEIEAGKAKASNLEKDLKAKEKELNETLDELYNNPRSNDLNYLQRLQDRAESLQGEQALLRQEIENLKAGVASTRAANRADVQQARAEAEASYRATYVEEAANIATASKTQAEQMARNVSTLEAQQNYLQGQLDALNHNKPEDVLKGLEAYQAQRQQQAQAANFSERVGVANDVVTGSLPLSEGERKMQHLHQELVRLRDFRGDPKSLRDYKKQVRKEHQELIAEYKQQLSDTKKALRDSKRDLRRANQAQTMAEKTLARHEQQARAAGENAGHAKQTEIMEAQRQEKVKYVEQVKQEAKAASDSYAQAQKDLAAATRDAQERLKVYDLQIDKAIKLHDKTVAEVQADFANPQTNLAKRFEKETNEIESLKQHPVPAAEIDGMGLSIETETNLRRLGLISDNITEFTPEGEAIWGRYSDLKSTLNRLGRHTEDKFIQREVANRLRKLESDKQLAENIKQSQFKYVKGLIKEELKIISTALKKKLHMADGRRTTIGQWNAKTARAFVGNLSYSQSSSRQLLARANNERLAAFSLLHSLEPDNLAQAYQHMVNAQNLTEMAIAAEQVRPWIDASLKRLRKQFASSKTLSDNYDMDTAEAAIALLRQVGLTTRKGERVRLEDIKRYNPAAASLIDSILNSSDHFVYYRQMTNGDLIKLISTVDNILAKAKEIKKTQDEIRQAFHTQETKELNEALVEANKNSPEAQERLAQRENFEGSSNVKNPTARDEFANVVRDTKTGTTKISFFCQRLDAWLAKKLGTDPHTEGPFYKYIYKPMRDAQTVYNKRSTTLARDLRPALDKYRNLDSDPKTKKGRVEIKADDPEALKQRGRDKGQSMYLEGDVQKKLIGIMVHLGSEENFEAVCRSLAVKQETMVRWIHNLEAQGIITKDMWDICQGIWDAYAKVLPLTERASYEIEGRRFKSVSPRGIKSSHGDYTGGYVPITIVDRNLQGERISDLTTQFSESMPNGSFTAERRTHYYTIDTTIEGSLHGIDEQLRYASFLPQANRVMDLLSKSEDIKVNLEAAYPDAINKLFTPWLVNTCRQNTGAISAPLRKIQSVASSLNASILALNIANAAQQLSGLVVGTLRIPGSAILWSLFKTNPFGGKLAGDIAKMSPYMDTRLNANRKNLRMVQQEVHTKTVMGHARDWMNQHAYVLQFYIQRYVDSVLWNAKYHSSYNAMVRDGVKPDMARAKSIEAADDAVRSTQGSFDMVDASLTEGSTWTKLLTPFSNYFVTMGNLNATEMGIRSVAHKAAWAKLCSKAYVFSLSTIVPTTMATAMAMGLRGKFNDSSKTSDDFLAEMGPVSWVKTYASMKNPMAGAIFSSSFDTIFGGKFSSNSVLTPPIATLVPNISKSIKNSYETLMGEKEMKPSDINNLAQLTALYAMPLPQVFKYLNFLKMVVTGEVDPRNTGDLIRGSFTGVPSPDQLK